MQWDQAVSGKMERESETVCVCVRQKENGCMALCRRLNWLFVAFLQLVPLEPYTLPHPPDPPAPSLKTAPGPVANEA